MLKYPSGFQILAFSDLAYEEMTVEIQFNDKPVAQINRDKGKDSQEITIPSRFTPNDEVFTFSLTDFIEILDEARKYLRTFE